MKKSRKFDNILDECLERVLFRGETVEQCLAGYPDDVAELEPLLRSALVVKGAAVVKPPPEFRERAGHQFRAALREMELKRGRGLFVWPRWATALIVVFVLLAGSGTVVAASNSMPDGALYQVKLATEAVRLKLTPSAPGKQELYVKLADKRVAEIINMADKGKVEQVERTTQRLNDELAVMASLGTPTLMAVAGAPQLRSDEAATVPTATPAPSTVPAPAPAPTLTVTAPRAPGPPEGAGPERGGGVGVGKANKKAELKSALSERAVANAEALREALERAPESARPALRQAIEVAGAGYERALESLD